MHSIDLLPLSSQPLLKLHQATRAGSGDTIRGIGKDLFAALLKYLQRMLRTSKLKESSLSAAERAVLRFQNMHTCFLQERTRCTHSLVFETEMARIMVEDPLLGMFGIFGSVDTRGGRQFVIEKRGEFPDRSAKLRPCHARDHAR